jgi:hypothetical protein
MKSKIFKTLFTAVVAGAFTLGASSVVNAAPLPQNQDTDKPSPGIAIPQDQDAPQDQAAPPEQAPPVDQAAPQQYPEQAPPAAQAPAPAPQYPNQPYPNQQQYAQLSAEQLQQLVAPIALYPDALVAQILSAAAYPTQIVEADRFVKENPDLKGQALGNAIDQQDWDPSVKALCQFPSVLANMDRDLSWTSELGEANYNQQSDVMAAIQYMRHKAYDAGNLRTSPQQRVYEQGPQVVIEPADPQVVYVPQYNPYYVYGYPVAFWPGFHPWWGFGGPFISFGFGFPIGPFFGFGWGWHAWGLGWGFHGGVFFGGHPYAWRGAGFYSHAAFVHGNFRGYSRGGFAGRGFAGHGFAGNRGFATNRGFANRGFAGNSSHSFAANRGAVGSNRSFAGNRSSAASSRGSFNRSAMRAPSRGGSAFRGESHGSAGHSSGGHFGGGHSSGHSGGGRSGGGHSGGGHGHGR